MFSFHQISSLAGLECTGNFTKCGEGLPQPHFLSWSDSLAEEPDFHRMEYFGRINFAALPGEVEVMYESYMPLVNN